MKKSYSNKEELHLKIVFLGESNVGKVKTILILFDSELTSIFFILLTKKDLNSKKIH